MRELRVSLDILTMLAYDVAVESLLKHKLLLATIMTAVVMVLGGLLVWGFSKTQPTPSGASSLPAAALLPDEWVAPTSTATIIPIATGPTLFHYIEVVDGCGPQWQGTCVNLRTGPGTEYPVHTKLRTGVVLKVADTVIVDGHTWYKIGFATGLRYPERVTGDLYVAADFVQLFTDEGDKVSYAGAVIENSKRIVVDVSEQVLYAYDGDELFMQESISTGKEFTPTPRGTFIIFKKTPSRYMQGPVPGVSDDYYDLPGVPWDLYFTHGGAVIHGAYWHENFGQPWSHGCVNLPSQRAKQLYLWADVGTPVTVQN